MFLTNPTHYTDWFQDLSGCTRGSLLDSTPAYRIYSKDVERKHGWENSVGIRIKPVPTLKKVPDQSISVKKTIADVCQARCQRS